MSLLKAGFPVYDANGNQYMFALSSGGYAYRMNNGNSSDGTAITRTVATGDFPLTKEFYHTSEIEQIDIYSKANSSADSVTLTHYGDGSTTGTTVNTFTQSHTGYGAKELRISVSNAIPNAYCLHKFKLSLPADDVTIGLELLSLDIIFRIGTMRTEEPA